MPNVRFLPHFDSKTNPYHDTMVITADHVCHADELGPFLKERGYRTETQQFNILVIKVPRDGTASMDELERLLREFCGSRDLTVIEDGILQEEEPAA